VNNSERTNQGSPAKLENLERLVQEQDAAIHHLYATVQAMTRRPEGEEAPQVEERTPMRDKVWACENCAARLGLYNEQTDELRVRYKDFCAYVIPGKGGVIKVPCRRCGEVNVLKDTREV
jgi:hypothetical protein